MDIAVAGGRRHRGHRGNRRRNRDRDDGLICRAAEGSRADDLRNGDAFPRAESVLTHVIQPVRHGE